MRRGGEGMGGKGGWVGFGLGGEEGGIRYLHVPPHPRTKTKTPSVFFSNPGKESSEKTCPP